MSRSRKKGPFVSDKLFRKIQLMEASNRKDAIRTWSRSSTVIPEFIGHTFMIHNGKQHIKVFITEEMVGHKLGEFAPTRTFRGHSGSASKKASSATGG